MSETEQPPEPVHDVPTSADHHDVPGGFDEQPSEPAPEPTTETVPSDAVEDQEHAHEDVTEPDAPHVDETDATEPPEAAATEPPEVVDRELGDPEEPHLLVIESLRTQVTDLMTQVQQLNSKLIKSFSRVSDLEDDLHVTNQTVRASRLKITALELERSEHLAALNTGLLVEKEHVTQELQRMMQRVTEEAAQRGEAETAKQAIESDLDDLSASLFQQANSMVAEARLDRARAARRLAECEEALKGAEDVVSMVQQQMQGLREEKEKSDRDVARMRELMGKGKYVEHKKQYIVPPLRLMKTHLPFKEFMDFITHLRSVRPTAQHPPPIASLVNLPFLARLSIEDSDPTVRFDFAPSLTWLTRRSFTNAVQQGLLLIEPLHTSTLLAESASVLTFSSSEVLCGLCGCAVFGSHGPGSPGHSLGSPALKPPSSPKPAQQAIAAPVSSWSTSRFLKTNPLNIAGRSGSLPTSTLTPSTSPALPSLPDAVIFVFRLSTPATQKPASPYPLCQSGWCLQRLRTTCELWGFVRRGIIDRVWEDDIPAVDKSPPPVPPPRKRMASRMGFWGMGGTPTTESGPPTPAAGPERILPARRHSEAPTTPSTPIPRRVPPPPTPEMLGKKVVHAVPPLPNGDRLSTDGKPSLPQRKSAEVHAPDPVETETSSIMTAVPPGVEVTTTEAAEGAEAIDDAETSKSEEIGDADVHHEAADDGHASKEPEGEQPVSVAVPHEEASPTVSVNGDTSEKPNGIPAAETGEHPGPSTDAVSVPRPSTPPRTTETDSPTTPSSAPPPRPPRRAPTRTRKDVAASTPGSSPTKQPVSLPSDGEGTPRRSTDAEQDDFMSAPSSPKSKPSSPVVERNEPALELKKPELEVSSNEEKAVTPSTNGITVADTLPQIATVPQIPEQRTVPPQLPPPHLPPRRAAPPKALPPPEPLQVQEVGEEGDTDDSTWEEKAWRELVRLREDMFLARIGAARATLDTPDVA